MRSGPDVVRYRTGAALVVALLTVGGSAALALFDDAGSVGHTISTNTLAAPTNPGTAAGACVAGVSDAITVSWTATTSTWAGGYEVLRATTPGGPYTTTTTATGAAATSRTVTGLAFDTTYYFVVRATKHAWRSATTPEVSRTTRSALCA